MSNCCSHGTLLHFSLQSSRLNICYYYQDLRWFDGFAKVHTLNGFKPAAMHLLLDGRRGVAPCRIGLVWARRSSAIHFQG